MMGSVSLQKEEENLSLHPPATQQKAAPVVSHFLNFLFAPESLT